MQDPNSIWLDAAIETVAGYRRMIDATIDQLSDDELSRRPADGINSVAIILRHLGGNLQSRWTDFLTSDGEKPSRQRDREFEDWDGDRDSLMAYFDEGWSHLISAIKQVSAANVATPIFIRGEPHTVPQALARSISHIAYHVGQIMIVARMVHDGQWQWLTVAPGDSQQHNLRTWGTAASRSILGQPDQPD